MVSERDVLHIAELADIGIDKEELAEFTGRFNEILDYFDILDQVGAGETREADLVNVFREDVVDPSLTKDEVLANTPDPEDGFFRAPRVM
ncbi:MAG: Asp-tRNA(Asn)/Glu-tRNA(Gln) amidotransferase subunit GatC [Methanoregulaceae archaeon]|jgi:aspartyl-tRNA(Asn)/glutamyl-tRNA(Gln) amidotransferase subunit C|nr:Asp-tRNA(Asn)/Glu-tRNA(Gln) amidotransferase subunit GatC [Methanoregulaceae archaeon]MCU0628078.1 Asp-tRNA(Asn)/Glu-tRNA(Gln) amidotransferase subunit GatC [Methanoregulaceae archaeon]